MTSVSSAASQRQPGGPRIPRPLAVVSAGLSQPSSTRLLADKLAAAVTRELAGPVEIVVIELRDLAHDITNNLLTGFPSPALREAIDQVAGADGIVAVTPLYNGSYSGLFKSFFDVLDPTALAGKPALLAATGGTARHSLALEHAVRPLFSYLRAMTVPTAVFAATDDWGSAGSGDPAAALGAGAGAGAGVGRGADAALGERIDRAAAELARLVDRRPAAAQPDPYDLVTPFDQLLSKRAG